MTNLIIMVNKIETGLEKTELYLGMLLNILDGDDKDVYFMERDDISEKLNFLKTNINKYSDRAIEGYCSILSNRVDRINSDLKQIILDNLEVTNFVNVDSSGNYATYCNGKLSSIGDITMAKYQLERMAVELRMEVE